MLATGPDLVIKLATVPICTLRATDLGSEFQVPSFELGKRKKPKLMGSLAVVKNCKLADRQLGTRNLELGTKRFALLRTTFRQSLQRQCVLVLATYLNRGRGVVLRL